MRRAAGLAANFELPLGQARRLLYDITQTTREFRPRAYAHPCRVSGMAHGSIRDRIAQHCANSLATMCGFLGIAARFPQLLSWRRVL